MSSSSFNVIRRHSSDATGIRIKELTQELARQRSQLTGSSLETDDIRSQGRMDHSTIKLNDERLKFITTLNSANTDFFYEFPTEPDFNYLKVWFMLDHLGARMRDMSGFGNDAIITGHPTLRRAGLDLGFQQTGIAAATPVMLFNSGTDVVSQTNGEYIWIPDNPSIQFTQFPDGFSVAFRFNCLNFTTHLPPEPIGGSYARRFASKTDNAVNGWNIIVYPTNVEGTQGGVEFEILHDNVGYARATTGYSINTWYQVVITYDPTAGSTSADRIKIYTAGIENSGNGNFNTLLAVHPNLRIGARSSETGFFQGFIHDFRLYMGKVLTQTEVTNINQNEMTIDNIPKGHTFVVQYALVSQAMASKTHKYGIGTSLSTTKTHKYNIALKVTSGSRTHKYNIFAVITPPRTRTHKYNIQNLVAVTKTHKFNVGGLIVTNKTHKYNMGGKLVTTRTHKYNVNVILTVTKTHKYNVSNLATISKTHKYNIIGKITKTYTHKYNAIAKLTLTRTHKYNVSEGSISYTLIYNVADSGSTHAFGNYSTRNSRIGTKITSTSHPLYHRIPRKMSVNVYRNAGIANGTIYYRILSSDGSTVRRTIDSITISEITAGQKIEITFENSSLTSLDQLELNEYLVVQSEGLLESGDASWVYYNSNNVLANTTYWRFRNDTSSWVENTTDDFAAKVYE